MKILTREFSKMEKILILILAVILLALCYYRFVHIPISNMIDEQTILQYQLQDEEIIAQGQAQKALNMQAELEALQGSDASMMPSYNGSKEELALLNAVLSQAVDYKVNFTTITREGDQIRRNFSLYYTANTYDEMTGIMKNLTDGGYRLLIDDVSVGTSVNRDRKTVLYNCTLSATFYETMVGGTPDAGLPADSLAREEVPVEEDIY